jgi:hypothetical protein
MLRGVVDPGRFAGAMALALTLLADPGEAATILSDSYRYETWVELANGSICCSNGTSADRTTTSLVDVSASSSLRSSTGTDSVESDVSLFRRSGASPGGFSVSHTMDLRMHDSEPASPHYTAEGNISYESRVLVDLETPPLQPNQTATFSIFFSVDDADWPDRLDLFESAAYVVNDLTTGSALASFSDSSPGSVSIDFATIEGHLLEIAFTGELVSNLPAGFGNGATGLNNRSFGSASTH